MVGRPFQKAGSSRKAFPVDREAFPVEREWSGGHPRWQEEISRSSRWVGRHYRWIRRHSWLAGSGREVLPALLEGLPTTPGPLGVPPDHSQGARRHPEAFRRAESGLETLPVGQ